VEGTPNRQAVLKPDRIKVSSETEETINSFNNFDYQQIQGEKSGSDQNKQSGRETRLTFVV